MYRWAPKVGLAVTSLLLALVAAELGLRATGFTHEIKPEHVEFGWPHPIVLHDLYDTDPLLFWVPKDYQEKLGRLEPGDVDIALLGDSCTELGTYPERLVEALRESLPRTRVVVESFGVGGWSSYQGLRQFERDVVPLRPKLATFYFGWNDHWIGFGVEDKELAPAAAADSRGLRLGQLALRAQLAHLVRKRSHRPERVAPEDFRRNLTGFTQLARASDIVPVLLTAPTSHEPGDEPEYLASRFVRRLEDLVPLHQLYADIVREVAVAEGAPICDLARELEALDREQVRGDLFLEDGIHPTPLGDEHLARLLVACFEGYPEIADLWAEAPPPGA